MSFDTKHMLIVITPSRQIWQFACQYCTVLMQQSRVAYNILICMDLCGYVIKFNWQNAHKFLGFNFLRVAAMWYRAK